MNFKDEYKRAAGDLTPDRECVDRMKAAVLRDISRPKVFPYKRVAVIGGAFAACAVITVAAITVIPMLRSSDLAGGAMLNTAISCDSCESAAMYSSDGDGEEAGADTNGNVSSQPNFDSYFEEAAPADALGDTDGRTPTVGGPASDETSGVISHGFEEPTEQEVHTTAIRSEDTPEMVPEPSMSDVSVSDSEESDPCAGDEPVMEIACVTCEAGTDDSGIEEDFPTVEAATLPSAAPGINETEDAYSEEISPSTDGYVPAPREDITAETEAFPLSEEASEETFTASLSTEQAEGETNSLTEEAAEEGDPCTGEGEVPPLLDGIEIIAKEELLGEGVTALRIVGNSAMIMNGDNVLIAYEAMFAPGEIPSESIIPRTGAEIDKYEDEGEYLVCSDDKKLIYVFDRRSEGFINAYRRIS